MRQLDDEGRVTSDEGRNRLALSFNDECYEKIYTRFILHYFIFGFFCPGMRR